MPIEESLAFGREKRATQGKRMQTLVGEEQEKDDAFWGDEKWKEDDAESEYSNESGAWMGSRHLAPCSGGIT